jgi:hypothetical protein
VVICISSFTTTLTGWQFKALAKQFPQGKDALAIFLAISFLRRAVGPAFSVAAQHSAAPAFRYRPHAFVLPVVVLAGSAGVLVLGTVGAALFLKGSDQVLRYSIDRSTIELLYLPMPHSVKLQAKWFIDTVVWRLGDGLAGAVVLVFATQLHWAPQRNSWIVILLTFLWLGAVFVAATVCCPAQGPVSQHRSMSNRRPLALDRSTMDFLTSKILASDPKKFITLDLFGWSGSAPYR